MLHIFYPECDILDSAMGQGVLESINHHKYYRKVLEELILKDERLSILDFVTSVKF